VTAERTQALPRRVGSWTATALVVGLIIGSGIFGVPAVVAGHTGGVGAVLLVWILAGIIALCGALSLSELATMFPRAGGLYVYLHEVYGPLVAFLQGWVHLVVNPTSWAAIALIFAGYVGHFVSLTPVETRVVAAAAVVVVCAASYRSIRLAAIVQNISTFTKVSALVGVTLLIFALGQRETGALAAPDFGVSSWSGFGLALVAALFAYEGWTSFTAISGEVREPGRTIPRALFAGLSVVVVTYLAVNVAYLLVLTLEVMAASPLVAVDAMMRVLGAVGGSLVAALVVISTFGALSAAAMVDPRVFFAMATDGLFPRAIGVVHPRYLTPHTAIAFTGAIAILYISIRTFEQLAEAFVIGVWPFSALAVAGVLILRRKRPDFDRPYRTVGYPVVPLVFLIASVGLIGNTLIRHPGPTLLSFAITLLGIPVYFAWRRFTS
jgi:APA family basic amino acid/polyamine antiporter